MRFELGLCFLVSTEFQERLGQQAVRLRMLGRSLDEGFEELDGSFRCTHLQVQAGQLEQGLVDGLELDLVLRLVNSRTQSI